MRMVAALPLFPTGWYNDQVNDEHISREIEESRPTSEIAGPAGLAEKSIVLLVMTLLIVLDQVSKLLIESWLPLNTSYQPFPAIGRFFQISHVSNTGAAFGLFPDSSNFFMVVAVIVSLVIVFYNWWLPGRHSWMRVALGMQLGGALGNFIDRIRLGHVTDFLDFGPWPVFNLADLSIVSGVVLMAFLLLREGPEREPQGLTEEPARDGAEAAEDRLMIWNE
jgi:signal peptidase II